MNSSNQNQETTDQQDKSKEQPQSPQPTMFKRCMTTLESKLKRPVTNLLNDLKPLTAEIKRLPNKTMKVASLKKGEPIMVAESSLKLHLLQIRMGLMEMMLTRRARKS